MKNIVYLKKELSKNIKYAKKQLKILYKDLDDATLNIYNKCEKYHSNIDDFTYFKLDLISNYQHQIGYLECLKNDSERILNVLNMDDIQLENFILKNKEIDEQNKKTMNDLKNKILNNENL